MTQIAMREAQLARFGQRACNLRTLVQSLLRRQWPLAGGLFERLAFRVLHDQQSTPS